MARSFVGRLMAIAMLLAAARAASAQGASLAGKVTDGEKGTPIGGANVQVMTGMSMAGKMVSGDDGSFRVGGLVDGNYTVVINRIGYSARRVEGVAVKGATTVNFTMVEFAAQLNRVVTTANRGGASQKELDIPASISVVSSETFESKPAPTLSSYLKGVPGISISQGGILQSNIVSRGFNNAFSGAMLNLQDYRFAGVPSLRVNVPALFTGIKEDIARIEVLNGPASSLYGPNSANGVLHIITKSPFESQGTTLALDGGNQSLFRVSGRHAGVTGDNKWGYKLSGEYFTAEDFKYDDPNEPATYPSVAPAGRAGQPLRRDFGLRRTSGEARLDYRPNNDAENIMTAGFSNFGKGIEVTTAFGAAAAQNWTYMNFQDRFKYKNFFAQVFYNASNSGNKTPTDLGGTYYLRTGIPVVDKSSVLVGQVQQSLTLAGWKLISGLDYIMTKPRSEGTIFGRNEGATDINEVGAYAQGAYPLSKSVELTAAVRGDRNDKMEGTQFSPRLAFTYKPDATTNWRASFSRAFNSPASFSFFLDQIANPNQAPGFPLRAVGNPPKEGWRFNRSCDATINTGLCMRSPFVAGGPGTPLASSSANAFPGFISQLTAIATSLPAATFGGAAQKAGFLGLVAQMMPILSTLRPTPANIGTVLRIGSAAVTAANTRDAGPLTPSFNNTWEVGYKAIIKDRIRVAADLWYQLRGDVGVPIGQLNPLVFYDPATLGGYLGAQIAGALIAAGVPAATAAAQAGAAAAALTPLLAALPQGAIALNNAKLAADQSIIATYRSGVGSLDVRGYDVAVDYQMNDKWMLAATYSNQGKIVFPEIGGTVNPLMSNSPKHRASGSIKYTDDANGWTWEFGTRYSDTFPVNSGLLNSLGIPPNPTGTKLYPDVPVQTIFDFSTSWRLPIEAKVTWSLNIQNINDQGLPTFTGTAPIGRLIMTRLQYTF